MTIGLVGPAGAWAGVNFAPSAEAPPVAAGPAVREPATSWAFIAGVLLASGVAVWALRRGGVLRRGALDTPRPRSPGAWPWFVFLAAAFMVVFGQATASALAQVFLGPRVPEPERLAALRQAAAYAVGIGLAVWVLRVLARGGAEGLGVRLSPADVRRGLLGALATLALAQAAGLLAMGLHRAITGAAPDPVAHDTLRQLVERRGDPSVWAGVALAVVAAPVLEELVFRGLVQTGLRRALGAWGSILTTSALFMAIHLGGGVDPSRWYALAPILVVGVACGVAFERTRGLGTPIVLHAAFNAANVGLALAVA